MSSRQIKRIANAVAGVKNKRSSALDRLRSMRVMVPDKRQYRRRSSLVGKVDAVVGGVVVAGPQGPERKKFDNNVGFSAVTSAAPYIASTTSGIVEGSQANQRIGGRVHIKAIDVELNWTGSTSTSLAAFAAPVYMDVMLVWDKQPDGGVTTVGTIFNNTNTNLTFGNLPSIERFQVLKRERLNMDTAAGYTGVIHWHQELDCATRFNDSSGSPISNDFYIVAITTAPGGVASIFNPQIAYIACVTFTDD